MFAGGVESGGLLILAVFVYALLDEDFLERGEEELFHEFAAAYLQFLAYEVFRLFGTVSQDVRYGGEDRLVVLYDTAVGREAHLAVGEGVEGVDGLV